MIIQIIVALLLLLVGGVISSHVSVQGSISIVNNDTMTMHLYNTDASSDTLDEILRKLHEAESNPVRVYLVLYLEGQVLVIEDVLDRNYLETESDKTAPRNTVETSTANYHFMNTRQFALKENVRETLHNDDVARITPQLRDINKLVDDIDILLRRIFLILETRGNKINKLIRRNSPRQSSEIYSQDFTLEYPFLDVFIADLSSENENADSSGELKMFLEYAKSVQDHLSSFSKALEAKWRQSRDHFNESVRRKLLTLQKKAQLLLDSLTEENQRDEDEASKNRIVKTIEGRNNQTATSLDAHRDLKNGNVSSAKEAKIERTTKSKITDNRSDKTKSLNGTTVGDGFHKIHNKTEKKNETADEIVLQAGTRFLNYPKATKNIERDFANTITTINKLYGNNNNNNLVDSDITEVTKSRDKNVTRQIALVDRGKNETVTKTEQHGENVPSASKKSSGEQNGTVKSAITEVAMKTLARHRIDNDDYESASSKQTGSNYRSNAKAAEQQRNADRTSVMMDEMLEAVGQVLS